MPTAPGAPREGTIEHSEVCLGRGWLLWEHRQELQTREIQRCRSTGTPAVKDAIQGMVLGV